MVRVIEGNFGTSSGAEPRRRGTHRRASRSIVLLPLLVVLCVVASLFYVWSRIQVIQMGYEISNALKEEKTWVEANKRLKLEIATLKSYARIERVAADELKMRQPKPDQVVVIR